MPSGAVRLRMSHNPAAAEIAAASFAAPGGKYFPLSKDAVMDQKADAITSLAATTSLSASGNENVNTHTFAYYETEFKSRIGKLCQASDTYYECLNGVSAILLEAERTLTPLGTWVQWTHACGISSFYKRLKLAHSPRIEELARLGKLPSSWTVQYQIVQMTEPVYRAALASGKIYRKMTLDEARALNNKTSANRPKKERGSSAGIGSAATAGAGKKRNGDTTRPPARPKTAITTATNPPVITSLAARDPMESDDLTEDAEPFDVDPELENQLPEVWIRVSDTFEDRYPGPTIELFLAIKRLLARDFSGFACPTVRQFGLPDPEAQPEPKPPASATKPQFTKAGAA